MRYGLQSLSRVSFHESPPPQPLPFVTHSLDPVGCLRLVPACWKVNTWAVNASQISAESRSNYPCSLLISAPFLHAAIFGLFCLEVCDRAVGGCNERVRTQVKIKCHIELEARWIEETQVSRGWNRYSDTWMNTHLHTHTHTHFSWPALVNH